MDQPPPFTMKELVACVGREVGLRRGVYPKWVATGRLSQDKANKEIAMMQEVYDRLKQQLHEAEPD